MENRKMAWTFTIAIMLIRKTFHIKNCKWEYLILLYAIQRPTAPWKPGWLKRAPVLSCVSSSLRMILHLHHLASPTDHSQPIPLFLVDQNSCTNLEVQKKCAISDREITWQYCRQKRNALWGCDIKLDKFEAASIKRVPPGDGNICCYAQTQFISHLIILSPWKCLVTVQRCISV